MSTETLRRLVADEAGECRDSDVERRIDRLESLRETVPADGERDVAALRALGDGTRYRLVRYLVAAHRTEEGADAEAPGELCVCELSPLVSVSDSAVSHALADLADAGLVDRRKDGQWRYYRATERAERLVGALDATRSGRGGDGDE